MQKYATKIELVNVHQEELTPRDLKVFKIKPETDFIWMLGSVKADNNKYNIRKLMSEKAFKQLQARGSYIGYIVEDEQNSYNRFQKQLKKAQAKKQN